MNNAGVIVGTTPENQLATWSQKDGLHTITLPPGFQSPRIYGINLNGDIIGLVTKGDGTGPGSDHAQAFKYSGGKFVILSQSQSKARALNDAGDVAGENNPEGPVLWSSKNSDKLTRLGGCCGGRALGMNNKGQIVGEANDKEGRFTAFLWDEAQGLKLIPPPDSRTSTALAITDSGHILMQSLDTNTTFIREGEKYTPVELSPEFASQPLAINSCDTLVGEFGANSEYYRAFIWDKKNGFRDLNALAGAGTDWKLESAVDINDRGEIVGYGDDREQEDAGFLLIPQEENSSQSAQAPVKK